MPTERVTLDMDKASLYFARYAAEAAGMSLELWLSKVAIRCALEEAGPSIAESNRLHPDEPPGWTEEVEAFMFRGDAE